MKQPLWKTCRLFVRVVLAVLACYIPAQASTLNVVTALSQNDPMYQGLLRFKQAVEQGSDNQIKVRLFVGSQLGNDNDILEQAMAGAPVAVFVASFAPAVVVVVVVVVVFVVFVAVVVVAVAAAAAAVVVVVVVSNVGALAILKIHVQTSSLFNTGSFTLVPARARCPRSFP